MIAMLRSEIRRFARNAVWSWAGWRAAWRSEKSLRQWLLANVVSLALALTLPLTFGERALIIALGLVVLAAELFNTAIEGIVDMVTPERDARAGRIKDCASAGVALAALAAGAAWVVVLSRIIFG